MAAKLKLGENDQPVYQDGKFVLVLEDGSETAFDAVGAYSTFGKIRNERDEWKSKAESAEGELVKFGKSADERAKAIERVKLAQALDEKKLVDAGKVDEVIAERVKAMKAEHEAALAEVNSKATGLESQLRRILVRKQLEDLDIWEGYLPTKDLLIEHVLERQFDLDGDQVVAFADAEKKSKLYSKSDPSRPADVKEAAEQLLKAHPNHDKWKKGVNATGSDATGNPKPGGVADASAVSSLERLSLGLAGKKVA